MNLNSRLYLDINHLARSTPWAHGVAAPYAVWGGALLLGLLGILAWWRARYVKDPAERVRRVGASLWSLVGSVIAVGIAQPINHLVAERRPYYSLHGVEVLVGKTTDYAFPSDHGTLAGAMIVGLWLNKDRVIAWVTLVAGLLLCFDRVYVGAHYPGDVLGGLALGGVVVGVLYPLALFVGSPLVRIFERFPVTRWLVASSGAAGAVGDGASLARSDDGAPDGVLGGEPPVGTAHGE
jgi:membrane-associated phospholipid phosphatase